MDINIRYVFSLVLVLGSCVWFCFELELEGFCELGLGCVVVAVAFFFFRGFRDFYFLGVGGGDFCDVCDLDVVFGVFF